jgi:hypothetical protein
VLRALCAWLVNRGWTEPQEIVGAIDLVSSSPSGIRTIFEAKTISDANEGAQCRSALGQLLEYRCFHGSRDDSLCLVVDRAPHERRVELLAQLGIAVVLVEDDGNLRVLKSECPVWTIGFLGLRGEAE